MKVTAKLKQGERILNDVQDMSQGITREHLVDRQDIHDFKMQFSVEDASRHENHLTSVTFWLEQSVYRTFFQHNSIWVDEMHLCYNPILLFKVQGEAQSEETDKTNAAGFTLVIPTQFQCDMFQAFGNNVVCVWTPCIKAISMLSI